MELKDLQEFLQDENNKEQFMQLADAVGLMPKENVNGLIGKRDELLRKTRELKDLNAEYKKVLDNIDLDEYNELKQMREKLDSKDQGGELSRLQREYKKLEERLTSIDSERQTLKNKVTTSTIKDSISKALSENNFDPRHKDLLLSAYFSKAKVEEDTGEVIIDDKPAADYFKDFANSDSGKPYIYQPANSGAASQKFSGTISTVSRKDFDGMSAAQKQEIVKGIHNKTIEIKD